MNRRAFIQRVPLVVVASAVAVEEAKAGILSGWRRKFFPGFGPGTIVRRLRYQSYPDLDSLLRSVYEPYMTSALFAEHDLYDDLYQPHTLYEPQFTGRVWHLRHDFSPS